MCVVCITIADVNRGLFCFVMCVVCGVFCVVCVVCPYDACVCCVCAVCLCACSVKAMPVPVRKAMVELRLRKPYTGVFVKLDEHTSELLKLVEPYVTFGLVISRVQ